MIIKTTTEADLSGFVDRIRDDFNVEMYITRITCKLFYVISYIIEFFFIFQPCFIKVPTTAVLHVKAEMPRSE